MDEKSALKQLIESNEFAFSDFLSRKTEGLVFDKRTLDNIYNIFKQFDIKMMDFPISSGKESVVFRVQGKKGLLVLKVFKTSTLRFQRIGEYIDGDPRFANQRKSRGSLVNLWVRKEYANLTQSKEVGVRVPEPFGVLNNLLLMKYIGTKSKSGLKLKDVESSELEHYLLDAMEQYKRMVEKAKLVHSDLSEYNILCYRKKAYLIDMGQAVSCEHPMAKEFLKRDMNNILNFAKRNQVDIPENLKPIMPGESNE